MQWRVRVEIPLKPTENEKIVYGLLEKIIDADETSIIESGIDKTIITYSKCLSSIEKLRGMLRRERILDAARKSIKINMRRKEVIILLHKQALTANRASLVENDSESPLGPVKIMIHHPTPKKVVDWIAPRTKKGKPIIKQSLPEPDCIKKEKYK